MTATAATEDTHLNQPQGKTTAQGLKSMAPTLALVLLPLAAYWSCWTAGFIWDDSLLLAQNPIVTGRQSFLSVWIESDFPLSIALLATQYKLWGQNPTGYHAVNLILHIINGLLLWRLLLRLGLGCPALGALLWSLHPLCVASVAWISEIKNLISTTFCLSAAIMFVRFDDSARSSAQPTVTPTYRYAAALILFVLALLAKTATVMLPVCLALYLWLIRRRPPGYIMARTAPFVAAAFLMGMRTVCLQQQDLPAAESAFSETLLQRLAAAGFALWFYLGKTLLPLGLCAEYPRWTVNLLHPSELFPLMAWVLIVVVLLRIKTGWARAGLITLACFTLNLLPVLGLINMHYLAISRVSDHFAYLPITSICAAAGTALSMLPRRALRYLLVAPVLGALGWATAHRTAIYSTEQTLWADTVRKNPAAWNAHNNLGCALAEAGNVSEAIQHFLASININPSNAQALCNLGRAYLALGNPQCALRYFEHAVKLRPNNTAIRRNYAAALIALGQHDKAAAQLRHVLALEPDTETHLWLASLAMNSARYTLASNHLAAAVTLAPENPDAINNLAWLLATCPDPAVYNPQLALTLAQRASKLTHHTNPIILGTLAAAYAESGDSNSAVTTTEIALNLARKQGLRYVAQLHERLLEWYRAGRTYRQFHESGITNPAPAQPQ